MLPGEVVEPTAFKRAARTGGASLDRLQRTMAPSTSLNASVELGWV